jgi:DNA-binding response OmpR family regulator
MTHCPLCGHDCSNLDDDFVVDLDSNTIRAGGQFRTVRPAMSEMAYILRKRYPGGVSREALINGLYGARIDDPPPPKILDVYASRLREALRGTGWTMGRSVGRTKWLRKL